MHRVGVLVLLCLTTMGCAQIKSEWELAKGVSPIGSTEFAEQVKSQYTVVNSIVEAAGMDPKKPDYYTATLHGFNAIEDTCTRYLTAIYRVDRNKAAATG